ncbi:lipoprotein releasing system, transmembrane prot ein LolC [Sulfurimonas gotlandica GD1]|uniref:Lipoprotein releasing system, transmembrane prot ein LolC n=1 Tax=Sulfurimonas gotlandica (strain DSM 19862 / JCM 16533 / GD1) TaxID=929558 RepID=B6BK74_SULGG|nr:ABC transporter permease [Sulfurimonas gotlandica]EDZ62682.1 lipoprotein release system transmembrane protein [Sulfurimonas gotlandica GD1]EHP31168.1 lipoprotein releasing system, transmembrane prot ein LolC [Sulfurimonas gotlandica GD1]
MKTSIVPYLVKRFLRFDNEQPFIFLSALLAFLGITLGVMVLLIAMALMNGFDKEFKKKLTIMNYPLTVIPKFYGAVNEDLLIDLESRFPELKFSPYVQSAVMARSGTKLEGGYIFGINFKDEAKVNSVLGEAIEKSSFSKFDVLIGKSLKDEFNLYTDDKLMYIFTHVEPGGLSITPKIKRFKVKGIFDSGLSAYDKAYSYTTLSSMQSMLGIPSNQYDGIHVFSNDPHADIVKIKEILPVSVTVKGWWEDNVNFFAALELEKASLFIVLMLIILIAAINIISSLLMTVMNRRSEIALLLSLGATTAEIKKVFLYLGIVIGVSGILAGIVFGMGGLWILSTFDIVSLPKDVYPTTTLPLDLSIKDFILIVSGAFVIVIASSFYPAKKASEVDILTVLRNE